MGNRYYPEQSQQQQSVVFPVGNLPGFEQPVQRRNQFALDKYVKIIDLDGARDEVKPTTWQQTLKTLHPDSYSIHLFGRRL